MRVLSRFCKFLAPALCFSASLTYAQAQSANMDSIRQVVQNVKTDTDKIKVLLRFAVATDCADTVHKLGYARDALRLAEKIHWQKGTIASYTALGEINSFCTHHFKESISYYLRADSLAEQIADKLKQAEILERAAYVYGQMTSYSDALECDRAVLSLKAGPDYAIPTLGNMGAIYQNIGDLPNALACYDSSLYELEAYMRSSKTCDKNDTLQLGQLLVTIGDIYRTTAHFADAMKNYDRALAISKLINEATLEEAAIGAIATTYKGANNFEKAIDYFNEAINIAEKQNDRTELAGLLDQLANTYLEKGVVNEAVTGYANKALKLAEENNNAILLPKIYVTLGIIYTRQKAYAKAEDYLEKSIEILKEQGALSIEKEAFEELSKTYTEMNQPALAFAAYRQAIALRDSIYNIDKANELTRIDLQSGYQRSKITDSTAQAGEYKLKIQRQQAYTYSGYAGLAVVLLLSFFIYRNYSQQKKANVIISRAKEKISHEKMVSESLLLNILPEEVATELKTNGNVQAKLFDNVTVMFTDFINFTEAAERFTPQELVAELHTCFMAFDKIVGMHGVEKIKTVGDAYVAASGLPVANEDHAVVMIQAALEIRDFMLARKRQVGDKTFDLRIGINSGTLVACIVGVKKFAYDIWGDSVNVAARMEQNSEAGKVNISQVTYDLVKDSFACEDRGDIAAKNKGEMRMYFVESMPKTAPNL